MAKNCLYQGNYSAFMYIPGGLPHSVQIGLDQVSEVVARQGEPPFTHDNQPLHQNPLLFIRQDCRPSQFIRHLLSQSI